MSDQHPAEFEDDLADLAEAISRNECILFLGAGVHAPPPDGAGYSYGDDERPMMGSELSLHLANKSGFQRTKGLENENPRDLARTSLHYQIERGRAALVKEVGKCVDEGRTPSPLLSLLAELDFTVVMTTNYDGLFERALDAHEKRPSVAVYSKERVAMPTLPIPTSKQPILIKLHGDLEDPSSLVITDEDYIDFVLRMNDPAEINPLPLDFQFYFKKFTTLFVGYSLLDFNMRVLFRAMRWKIDEANFPPAFALDITPDPLISNVWWGKREYVRFVSVNAWSFVPALHRAAKGNTS